MTYNFRERKARTHMYACVMNHRHHRGHFAITITTMINVIARKQKKRIYGAVHTQRVYSSENMQTHIEQVDDWLKHIAYFSIRSLLRNGRQNKGAVFIT